MKSALFIRRVVGHSMEPTLRQRQLVVASGWLKPRPSDLVVAVVDGLEVIKRAAFESKGRLKLSGERHGYYADVEPSQVLGRVIRIF